MAGFDDLIPQQAASRGDGGFDDLVPKAEAAAPDAPGWGPVLATAASRGVGQIGDYREKALSYLPENLRGVARAALNLSPVAPGALGMVPTSQHIQDITGITPTEPQGLGQEAAAGATQMATNPLSYAGAGGLATKLAGALTGGAGAGVGGSLGENIAGTPGRVAGSVIGGGIGGAVGGGLGGMAQRAVQRAETRAATTPPSLPKEAESTFAPTTVATKAGKESDAAFKERIRNLAIANGTLKYDNAAQRAAAGVKGPAKELPASRPLIPPAPVTPPVLGLGHSITDAIPRSPGAAIGGGIGAYFGHHVGHPLIGAGIGAQAGHIAQPYVVAGARGAGGALTSPAGIRGGELGLTQALQPPPYKPADVAPYQAPGDTPNTILGPAMQRLHAILQQRKTK